MGCFVNQSRSIHKNGSFVGRVGFLPGPDSNHPPDHAVSSQLFKIETDYSFDNPLDSFKTTRIIVADQFQGSHNFGQSVYITWTASNPDVVPIHTFSEPGM